MKIIPQLLNTVNLIAEILKTAHTKSVLQIMHYQTTNYRDFPNQLQNLFGLFENCNNQ